MSFFLIRLLQNFSHMELDLAAQPPSARPPAEWATAEGHKSREKIVAKTHLTMYADVSTRRYKIFQQLARFREHIMLYAKLIIFH